MCVSPFPPGNTAKWAQTYSLESKQVHILMNCERISSDARSWGAWNYQIYSRSLLWAEGVGRFM